MYLLELIKVVIIGITEGVTEWLPISSTGHMILLSELMRLDVSDEFLKMFLVVIQLGAICAVPTLYRERILPFGKDAGKKRDVYQLWCKVVIGTVPALLAGFLIEASGLDVVLNSYIVVAAALVVYGVVYIYLPKIIRSRMGYFTDESLSAKDAFMIGLFQALALIPGTSRSGSTMLGGMILGKDPVSATEFSFVMAIPVMLGASVLKILKFFASGCSFGTWELFCLLVGMLVSYGVSIVSIRFLLSFVKRHGLRSFGIYRIILGTLVILIYVIKKCG